MIKILFTDFNLASEIFALAQRTILEGEVVRLIEHQPGVWAVAFINAAHPSLVECL